MRGLPVRNPYQFGCGRCNGPAWANCTGLIWLSVLSRNQKFKHANKQTFFNHFKKGTICINSLNHMKLVRLAHTGLLQRPRPNWYGSCTGSPCRARMLERILDATLLLVISVSLYESAFNLVQIQDRLKPFIRIS